MTNAVFEHTNVELTVKSKSLLFQMYQARFDNQPPHKTTILPCSLAKELWRLRVNFFALLVLVLANIGYMSPLASLHQFVTNPTLEEQNGTQMVQSTETECFQWTKYCKWM